MLNLNDSTFVTVYVPTSNRAVSLGSVWYCRVSLHYLKCNVKSFIDSAQKVALGGWESWLRSLGIQEALLVALMISLSILMSSCFLVVTQVLVLNAQRSAFKYPRGSKETEKKNLKETVSPRL